MKARNASRQLAKHDLQQDEDADGGDPNRGAPAAAPPASVYSPSTSALYSSGNSILARRSFTSATTEKITAAGIGRDIDPTPEIFSGDDVGTGLDADIRDFLRATGPPSGVSIRRSLEAGDVVAGVRRTPDIDIIGTSVLEHVADFRPGNQGGRGPAHIAWLQTVFLGRSKVGRDIDLRHFLLQVDKRS